MEPIPAFFLGLGSVAALALLVVLFVRGPMRRTLHELCGAGHRADFWLHLYEASTVLTVVFCALLFPPGREGPVGFFDFLAMVRAGIFGLLGALGILTLAMMASISSFERKLRRTAPLPRDENGAPRVRGS